MVRLAALIIALAHNRPILPPTSDPEARVLVARARAARASLENAIVAYTAGGAHTLRGYGGGTAVGSSFLRARSELAFTTSMGGLSLFSDAGWAGERQAFHPDAAHLSAGVGATFLDSLMRIDLARALRHTPGWRLELNLDSLL
ncbi:MAG: hypothetical protein ACRENP_21475 [Longimicrobiales bacterium]